MPTSAPQGRGGARHFKKPYVETGLLLKLLKKHEDLLLDLKGYESRSRNSAVDPKALHRCLPLLEDIVALEPSAEVHPQPLRNALLQLLATNPKLNSTRFNGSVWTNMKAERLNVLLSHVRKLARSGGSSCLAALTGSEFERLTETLQKVVLRPEDEAALEKEKGGVTWQAAERGELSLKEKVKQIADENSDIDDAADALQDSMTKGEKSKAWNRHQNHLKKDENAKEEFDNLGRLSMICDTAAPHSSYPALKGKTKKVRAKKGWVEEIVDELQPFIREIGYDIDEDALKVLLEYLKAAEPTASKLCIPKIQAFARQALLIDCSDKRLTLLFQSLDHASAAIVYTLLSLDKHLDDAAGKPEGAGKGAQHAMEYLRRLQACEESFACKLFPNAQMQFPCVVLEYKHQFQLLKTTDLAEKYNEDMWGPDKTSYWVTGALAFVPEHRLSPDRKFLVQDYMNRIPKLGEEKFKRVKWDSVVLVELDMAEAFQIDVRARSKRATGLQQLQKGSDGSLNRTIQDGKNLLEAVFLGDALSPEAVSGSVVQRWLQRPLLGGALAEGDRRKTLLCKQYFEGGCNRGGNCAFAHGETEQRQPPGWQEKPKMKLCEKFPNFCEFGRYCHNAHGQDELQVRAPGPRLTAQPEAEQVDYPQPEAGERQKTLLCRFAAMGTCKHGDDCKFAHGEHEQERPIDWEEKPKSRFCSHFRERRFCQFGRYCVFAHAEEELQEGDRRKTLLCKQYFEGGCNRGGDCDFAHGEAEQRQPPGWQEKPKMKLCEKFPNFCEFGRYCHNAHGQDELQVRAPGPRLTAQPEAEQVDYPQPEAGERQKTLLCRFAAMGTCKHGDDCKFAHGEHEQERPIDWEEKPKSRFCSHFRERRFCQFGRYCVFAHAEEELQEGDRRKTLLCKQYFEGGCNRGGDCDFAHGEAEQRQPPGWQEKPKMKLCEKFPNFCEFGRYCHNAHGQDELQVRVPPPPAPVETQREQVPPPPAPVETQREQEGDRRKTLLCKQYFKEGGCSRGGNCAFAHGEAEQRQPPGLQEKPKMKLCEKFQKGFCEFGRYCHNAHGQEKPKEELCKKFFQKGFCKHGRYCPKAHAEEELQEKDKTKLCESRYFSGFCAKGRYCAYAHQRNEIKEERPSTRVEARTLSEGGLAKVHGMSDDADLNGCQVKLLAWEEDKKQWIIQLPNGRPRTLPQDNLSPVPDAKADQEDAMRQLQGSLQGQFAEGVDPLQVCDPWAAAKAGGRSKILLCLFHFLQKCGAGDSCDYAHNEDEQVEPLNYQARTFKNKMCKDFFPYGFCPRGKYCDWAHDPDELYKAKSEICRHFLRAGECRHGAHCLYAHGTNDLLHDKVGPLAFAVREMLGDDTWLKVVLDWALGRSPQPFVC
ncbi:unnamed protein product [Effrenium voratum]|uniref:C3H1-type domain-containing protein n=1 Tax=Effrenium voratum TaxID=2562239 RepID=A0AA36HNF0_9DINO|nr:unnamed protein product [Effrenium voratum]